MNTLTKEDINNIVELIKLAPINGGQSLLVAGLLYKLSSLTRETKAPENTTKPIKEVPKPTEVKKIPTVATPKKK